MAKKSVCKKGSASTATREGSAPFYQYVNKNISKQRGTMPNMRD